MSPLLSIAIPTFNRSERIKILYENILSNISTNYDEVEIIVCDNSDAGQAGSNQKTFSGSNIKYKKNIANVGFSGNLIRCLKEAKGEFIWVISDDDEVDYNAFGRLLAWLKKYELNSFNAVMLPFYNSSESGEWYLMNTSESWGDNSGELSGIVRKTNKIPFILFSSVIIRNPRDNKEKVLDEIASNYEGNDFIQIPLFVSFIGKTGKLTYYSEALQEYKSPDCVRFSLIRMVESLEQAINFITGFYGIIGCQFDKCHYQRWMQWLILHRAGIIPVKDGDAARWILLRKWYSLHFKNMRHLKLLCLVLFPKALLKKIYPK